jgi:hypothetical protein
MPPDSLHLFIGDLHAGSTTAVMQPFANGQGITFGTNRVQDQLMAFWRQALAEVKKLARGHRLILHLGGDCIDGDGHHGTPQTVGVEAEQAELAVSLLLPWANLADRGYALLGTDSHVGPDGASDKGVARELGLPVKPFWRLDCSGRLLDWAHHTGLGRREWTTESALIALANNTLVRYLRRGLRAPDLIVRHHVHRYVRTHAKGIDVVTAPGWQAQTKYIYDLDPSSLLTVGVVAWWPRRNEIKELLYDFPEEAITVA